MLKTIFVAGLAASNVAAFGNEEDLSEGKSCADPKPIKAPYGGGDMAAEYPAKLSRHSTLLDIRPIGAHTANLAEAGDAVNNPELIKDGKSGDTEFPHGNLKPIATVGEAMPNGFTLTGVPDGMGSYLLDKDTVRMVWQSESYGNISGFESYAMPVNHKVSDPMHSHYELNEGGASYTGSHVMYVDYDREGLENHMNSGKSAEHLVKGYGNAITKMYNLNGDLVGPRNRKCVEGEDQNEHTCVQEASAVPHFGNTDTEGNWVTASYVSGGRMRPTFADWVMMSLCSAHLEEKHQWGPNVGVEDRMFLTNEEWTMLMPGTRDYVGLSAHAVDLATQTSYATGAFTNGGFEKITEINSQSTRHVAFAVSGYNGAFGDLEGIVAKKNDVSGNRPNGEAWVSPQNVVPARIYVGVKGLNAQGEEADDFLSRNGLAYGQLYGFATDESVGHRDDWHKEHYQGDEVEGHWMPIDWRWSGKAEDFSTDGSWHFQIAPKGAPEGVSFWNGKGNNESGKKTEHCTPSFDGEASFVQSSTAGYFGKYTALNLGDLLRNVEGSDLPESIPGHYHLYQGETKITDLIDLGGKGLRSDGKYQNVMTDNSGKTHETFEDIDAIELIAGKDDKEYLVIQEDGGNAYGERMFIVDLSESPLSYKFVAQSGGALNSRAMVGIPAGTANKATTNEFSGAYDMSAYFVRGADGEYVMEPHHTGATKHELEKQVDINDKLICVNLQAHGLSSGAIHHLAADRGGQWFAYQPQI